MTASFDFRARISVAKSEVDSPAGKAAVERRIRERLLAETLASLGWNRLRPGTTFDVESRSRVIIIGVASWSHNDLDVLEALRQADLRSPDIVVFDIDEFPNAEAIAEVLPGALIPSQSPVIAEYRNGKLVGQVEGRAADDYFKTL